MIRYLRLLRLRCQAWWLLAQLEHVEEQIASFQGRRRILYNAVQRTVSRMNMIQSPENIITNALRRSVK